METIENNSQSQQQFLQPVSKFCPPNDIISKNYAPDEKPVLRLMYIQLRRLQKSELKSSQQTKKLYKSIFESDDTLGYTYSYALNNDIVYLKFNNQNYFKCKIKNLSYRFLAGMFIPIEKLISPQVKSSKNIYKVLPDIQFVEYKNHIQDSFGKNCRFMNSKTLRFSSNYQSANLFIAMKKKQFQYDLILQNDINSKGNTQWFNFAVEFHQQGVYKFNILNFTKSYSQFEDGMRIVYYSFKEQETSNGWSRGCINIQYEESTVRREDADCKNYSCLRFQYNCSFPNDKVIFAYFYPYTSIDLQKYLKKTLYRKINVHMKMQKIKVCETISGLPIYAISIQHKRNHKPQMLAISNVGNQKNSNSNIPLSKPNKSVIFFARQHPGQTQGSFLAQGIIDILMQNGQFDYLKKGIDFYIFPMVNIQGVLYGNYRTNLSGADLNRVWRNPRIQIHPEIYFIKKYLYMINKQSPITLLIDLHGHSKSLNSFFYGNPPKKDILTGNTQDPRLFPYVCSKKIKQISFTQSSFTITQDKKNSARVVISQMFPRAHVYTLENSFHGWMKDNITIHEYTPDVLRKIGRQLVLTYLQFDKLCQKNPQIKQKWIKQISQIKIKNQSKSQTQQPNADSDSQAEFQLIDLQQDCNKIISLDSPNLQKQLFGKKQDIIRALKKQHKQNFITRNLLMKNHINQRSYEKYNRKLASHDSQITTVKSRKQIMADKKMNNCSSQGFLSIIKIKTTQTDPNGLNNNQLSGREQKTFKQNIIERLRRKKIKIQQAVHSNLGMKSFLRAMGIPLEKKLA